MTRAFAATLFSLAIAGCMPAEVTEMIDRCSREPVESMINWPVREGEKILGDCVARVVGVTEMGGYNAITFRTVDGRLASLAFDDEGKILSKTMAPAVVY